MWLVSVHSDTLISAAGCQSLNIKLPGFLIMQSICVELLTEKKTNFSTLYYSQNWGGIVEMIVYRNNIKAGYDS